mgnify:CR=1 FL=1
MSEYQQTSSYNVIRGTGDYLDGEFLFVPIQ